MATYRDGLEAAAQMCDRHAIEGRWTHAEYFAAQIRSLTAAKEQDMPTKNDHRVAIQHAIITAAFDLGRFNWSADDAQLLHVVNRWLDNLVERAKKSPAAGEAAGLRDWAGVVSGISPELDRNDARDDDEDAAQNVPRQGSET